MTVRFSVGSLNLHCGRDLRGRPFPLRSAVRSLDTDVVLLQENWRPEATMSPIADVATELGYDKPVELDVFAHTSLRALRVAGGRHFDEAGSAGLAILTRIPLELGEPVALGHARRDAGPRLAQVATVAGGQVRLVNTHLTHVLPFGPGQLRRLMTAVPAHAAPTVIAGDFNMFRPTIRLARGYRQVVHGRTWPAPRPIVQLDHILVSPDLRASASWVGDPIGSDHLPIRVTITLP